MRKKGRILFLSRGQAVIELAIFGAILIFLVAAIVQQGMAAAFSQNETLQSTRLALLKSYQTSRGKSLLPPDMDPDDKLKSGARNSAAFLFIEDRLSPGVTRYGVADRQPLMSMGSGTLSNKLFWVSDWDDLQYDSPLFDLQVNGQAFVFKNGLPVVYRVRYTVATGAFKVERIETGTGQSAQWDIWFRTLAGLFKNNDDTLKPDAAKKRREIEEKLRYLLCKDLVGRSLFDVPGDVNPLVDPLNTLQRRMELDRVSTGINDYIMFQVIVKNDAKKWVDSERGFPRYDLQRNNNEVPDAFKGNFLWKWKWKLATDVMKEIDWENSDFPSYDVDGDLKEETVYHITKYVHSNDYSPPNPDPFTGDPLTGPGPADWDVCNGEKVYDVAVMDYTVGEMSSSGTENDPNDEPGLKSDTHVYSLAQQGTVLQIREGASFVGSQELALSMSSKQQYDLVSREVQLNKNMICSGTICDPAYFAFTEDSAVRAEMARCRTPGVVPTCLGAGVCCADTYPNPPDPSCVQTCTGSCSLPRSCCARPENVYRTCFDGTLKRLFVRSRIEDKRGRMWVTRTGGWN